MLFFFFKPPSSFATHIPPHPLLSPQTTDQNMKLKQKTQQFSFWKKNVSFLFVAAGDCFNLMVSKIPHESESSEPLSEAAAFESRVRSSLSPSQIRTVGEDSLGGSLVTQTLVPGLRLTVAAFIKKEMNR